MAGCHLLWAREVAPSACAPSSQSVQKQLVRHAWMQIQDAAEVYLGSVQTLKYGALKNGETKVNLPVNMRRLLTNAKYATANSTAGAAVADLKPEKGEALSESCSCYALRSPAAYSHSCRQCCHVKSTLLHCTACSCRTACLCFAAQQLNACPCLQSGARCTSLRQSGTCWQTRTWWWSQVGALTVDVASAPG